jgi:hypothetical protein
VALHVNELVMWFYLIVMTYMSVSFLFSVVVLHGKVRVKGWCGVRVYERGLVMDDQ